MPTRSSSPAKQRAAAKPYLITKDETGAFRVTVRTTRFNSQGYPLMTAKVVDQDFKTAMLARAYVRAEFRAEAGDIATK